VTKEVVNIPNYPVELTIDPHNMWPDLHPMQILQSCGFLPKWFVGHKPPETIKDHMERSYGFGAFPMQLGLGKSRISDDGIHTYPGDPPLYPHIIMKNTETNAEMIQWESGIVAFRDNPSDEWFLTRMD